MFVKASSYTVPSNTTSFTLNLPSGYDDLYFIMQLNLTNTSNTPWYDIFARPNGSTSNIFSQLFYYANNASANPLTESAITIRTNTDAHPTTSGYQTMYIPRYSDNTVVKPMLIDCMSDSWVAPQFSLWNDTSAITTLVFEPLGGSIKAGSYIDIYGITHDDTVGNTNISS